MNRPRWRKVLSDLWSHPVRSLLVVASITVGLFAIGVIATLYVILSTDMSAGYASVNPANIQVRASDFEQELVDHVERLEGVHSADGTRNFSLRLESRPGEWIAIDLKTLACLDEARIDRLRLIAGRLPTGRDEIAIDRYKLADTRAQIGDSITLELASGKTRPMQLVGVVHDQTIGAFGVGAGFFIAPVQGYIDCGALEWLGQPDAFNRLAVTVGGDSGDVDHIREVADRVREEVEDNDIPVVSLGVRSSFDHPNRIFVDAIAGVLFLLGLLVVFLSGFLITNTLQALLNQQVQLVGIMKTVGARRGQIIGIYMLLILILGLLAFLVALPLAHAVSFRMLEFLAYRINFVLGEQRLIPGVMAIELALALVMPQLAAFLPIWQGTRLSVQEALSGLRQNAPLARGGLQEHIMRLRGFSRPLLISIRNTVRRRGRLILTLLTLTLGGAIFIATFNVRVSMQQYTEDLSRYFLADINLSLDRPHRIAEVQELLARLPEVDRVEGWAGARSELVLEDGSIGDSVQLLGPPVDSVLVSPIVVEGRWLLPGDHYAVTLNENFKSRFPDLKPGGTIRLRVNGRERDWTVVGFFQFAGRSGGYIAYTSYDVLSELIGQSHQAVSYRVVASQPDLNESQQEALGRQLEARLEVASLNVSDVTTGHSLSTTASEGFSVLTAFLLFLALLTALVGSIGLAGTMSLNVMERTREIGVMRAIGASDGILMKMVILEGMIIGFLSWLLGSLLAFPISKLLADSISLALFDDPASFRLTPTGFIIWLGLVLILSVLASVLPARSAARLTIREVLAYE